MISGKQDLNLRPQRPMSIYYKKIAMQKSQAEAFVSLQINIMRYISRFVSCSTNK